MNRKVIGAEKVELDGYKFRSRLEAKLWDSVFRDCGLDIRPEPEKIVLQEAYKPVPFYEGMVENTKTQRSVTYTPDFIYYDSDGVIRAIIEVKGGFKTDKFDLKRKFILRKLSLMPVIPVYFEIHNIREARFCVDICKNM